MAKEYTVKVNERGQMVIPKEIRDEWGIKNTLRLIITEEGIMIKPVTLIDEFDDLILKDLKTEGVPEDELEEKMLERKKQITKAYLEELEYRKKEDAKGRPLEEIIKELGLDL